MGIIISTTHNSKDQFSPSTFNGPMAVGLVSMRWKDWQLKIISSCELVPLFSPSPRLINLTISHEGCFCCIGGCQEALGITGEQIEQNFFLGRSCQNTFADLINGSPTGKTSSFLSRSHLRPLKELFVSVWDT
jgi:hypothetical protein